MERKNHQNGFTLLELLVVIALSGLIMWVSVPSTIDLLSKRQLRESALDIRRAIRGALSRAYRTGGAYLVDVLSDQLLITRENDLKKIEAIYPPKGVEFTPRQNPVRLLPGGTSSPSRILLFKKDNYCEVIVSLRGRTRIQCR